MIVALSSGRDFEADIRFHGPSGGWDEPYDSGGWEFYGLLDAHGQVVPRDDDVLTVRERAEFDAALETAVAEHMRRQSDL